MTPSTIIQNYLLLHLSKELPGLDVWRANVIAAKTMKGFVRAGEAGQADLTGIWGGRCIDCGRMHENYEGCREFRPSGRSIWIEVKHTDQQSQAQKDFERRVKRLGALYIICRVRRKETVTELADRKGILPGARIVRKDGGYITLAHPAEIQAFFDELRTKL